MTDLKSVGIHGTELAGYSGVVGQPIMLKNEAGQYIGQLALIGFQGDYKEAVAAISEALDAPNRHTYKACHSTARKDALRSGFIAGARAVHDEWIDAGGFGAPRGEPDFSEAADDYATSLIPKETQL